MILKQYLFLALILLFSFPAKLQAKVETIIPDKATAFKIKRGVNISHWLSQSNRRGQERKSFFTEEDVRYIADLGFDHIRIPIDEEQMFTEDGEMIREAFDLLHQALEWSGNNNLKVVVDLHILRSHYFNAEEKPLFTEEAEQERFFALWKDLSAELRKYDVERVAYELMNEPVADDPEDWNRLVAKALEVIREKEPGRIVVIGSNRWQNADTFDVLRIPENDPNIMLSFHMYEPMLLTHHQASWTRTKDYKGPVNYPGEIVKEEDLKDLPQPLAEIMKDQQKFYDKATIEKHFEKPIQVAKRHNLPLYCGEWGVYPAAPTEARLQWYEDVREVLEANGIAWAIWDYKGGFGIIRNGEEDTELIETLLED